MRLYVYPYNGFSDSAKQLSRALGAKRIRHDNSRYRHRNSNVIINWGSTVCPYDCLNSVTAVKIASNKLLTLAALKDNDVPHPEWTVDAITAYNWTSEHDEYKLIGFARTKLDGHSGEGIIPFYSGVEYSPEGEVFPQAPLYTRYILKKTEFRVHVFNGEIIDVQEKRKVRDHDGERNSQIRVARHGWVYCRDSISEPPNLRDLARNAVRSLGLLFGAVDVIWNNHYNQGYVLEVNTAPGLEGSTITNYANAINSYLRRAQC